MTTEKVTTSDEVHKRIEKFKTSEEVVKVFDEVHKFTENITTNEDVDKGTEKSEDTKEAVVTIRKKDSDKFEGHYKGSTGWFNLDNEVLNGNFSTIEPDLYKTFMKNILKVKTWNRIKCFSYRLILLS